MSIFKGPDLASERQLTRADIEHVAYEHIIEATKIAAIVDVEAAGQGYFDDGRLAILFEAHKFSKHTGGRFDETHPNISAPRWNRSLYWGGPAEYVRLKTAMTLDQGAAVLSASYGLGQILGENYSAAGYYTAEDMIRAFAKSPRNQLSGIMTFIDSKKLKRYVDDCDWARFARGYNGRSYALHRYHLRLALAWARARGESWARLGAAGALVRDMQTKLSDYNPGAIDGALGPKTAAALLAFQLKTKAPYPQLGMTSERVSA